MTPQPLAASHLIPDGSNPPRLIICEHTGRWAVALRRELGHAQACLLETRHVADCWHELARAPASLLVLELTASSTGELTQRIAQLEPDFPLARVAVVAHRSLAEYEWLIREAGAAYFTCSPRRLGLLARLASRHLDRAPVPRQTVAQRIWAGLPWKRGRNYEL